MAGADGQLARRFFEDHPELFKTQRRDGYTWVYPRRAAFHLNRRKHRAKTADGDGATGKTAETGPDFAKDRARAMLSKVAELGSDSLRADMLGELGTELASVADVWNVFERINDRGTGPEYLCLPYWNRFNSEQRASNLRASWRRAWRRARRQYDDAVVVTLTTDPKRHDNIADATDGLIENKNRLSSWLAYDLESGPSRPGFRPSNLYVLEFTDSGIPHLHVVYFGVRWLTPQWNLVDYWDERGQGRVVDVRRLSKRGEEFVMPTDALPDDPDADGKRTARSYLGKSLRSLSTVASMDPGGVVDAASARRSGDPRDADDALWKVALYWALERRFFSGSPELTNDDPDGDDADSLPQVRCYRYVGTAEYSDLPGYVRDRGLFLTRRNKREYPPPPRELERLDSNKFGGIS
jgi:hypothetical protein